MGKGRVRGNFDVYNILNGNTIRQVNNRYGAQWRQPAQIMSGRLVKFSTQLDF